MFDKMKQLYEMQKKAKEVQKAVETIKIDRTSSGGKVRLVMNGSFKVETLTIDPSVFAPEQRPALEKALAQLISDVADEVKKESAAQAMNMMKEMNIKLPGF